MRYVGNYPLIHLINLFFSFTWWFVADLEFPMKNCRNYFFPAGKAARNFFLSDLWRGHDETFTVHKDEPCMNFWLLSAVKCEWIVSQTMISNWSFSLYIILVWLSRIKKMSSFLYIITNYDGWMLEDEWT